VTKTILLTLMAVISLYGPARAMDWAARDLYRDAPVLLMMEKNFVDLSVEQPSFPNHAKKEKTLGSHWGEFTRESLISYMVLWGVRGTLSPQNVKSLLTISVPHYLHFIAGWQGCNGGKSRQGLCSPVRRPFWNPRLLDGDRFRTNFLEHPAAGALYYLTYRARGYDKTASSLGSFLQSTLFEYTVEGLEQPPSFTDLIFTPGLGVPMGIVVEEVSDWLIERDNQFLRALAYFVNPTRAVMPDGDFAWQNFGGFAFRFQW
jgi:hypothetical protein